MRVTENMNYDQLRGTLSQAREKIDHLQSQASSMKRLLAPSDDPVATAKVLEIRSEQVNSRQFQENASLALTFLESTDAALNDLSEVISRAKEIAIGQASSVNSGSDAREGVAEEVKQLYLQALSILNRKLGARYIFGGFKTQTPPFTPTGHYLGDQGLMRTEIAPEVYVSVNIPGSQIMRPPGLSTDAQEAPNAKSMDLFNTLALLEVTLSSDHSEGIRSSLEPLDDLHIHLVGLRSKVGSKVQSIMAAQSAMGHYELNHAALNSALEDADMAYVTSELSKQESIFKSALASSQRLVQPTLLDFLR